MPKPADEVGGDGFDLALDDDTLQWALIDAMGHELTAVTMTTLVVSSYRRVRCADVDLPDLPDLYAATDSVLSSQFGTDRFVTAQMARPSVSRGELRRVDDGRRAPLCDRGGREEGELTNPTTLPVGFGGRTPRGQHCAVATR
ncbi:MAG: SpoIIE family protein phosphatase [Janthinobacterium lividum]